MRMTCDKCGGTGDIPLPDVLQETYEAVRSGLHTTEEIYRAAEGRKFFGKTAVNQRLDRLFDLGLISRQRRGKIFYFTAVGKPERKSK